MKFMVSIALLAIIGIQEIKSVNSPGHAKPDTKELVTNGTVNPLANLILNQNGNENGIKTAMDKLNVSREKRQIVYDPYGYYYGRRPYYPIPIIVGLGGIGYGGFRGIGYGGFGGGRGFGGRGFGGRGFGGRGFGGGGGRGGGRG